MIFGPMRGLCIRCLWCYPLGRKRNMQGLFAYICIHCPVLKRRFTSCGVEAICGFKSNDRLFLADLWRVEILTVFSHVGYFKFLKCFVYIFPCFLTFDNSQFCNYSKKFWAFTSKNNCYLKGRVLEENFLWDLTQRTQANTRTQVTHPELYNLKR